MKKISRQKWGKYFLIETLIFIGLIVSILMSQEDQFKAIDIVGIILTLLFIPFSIYLFIKSIGRLKDVGISGWWMLLIFIPIIGWGGLLGLLFLKSAEHRKEKISNKKMMQAIVFGGGVAMAILIIFSIILPDVGQNSVVNVGSQISIDREKGEVNVKKVNVNPKNVVQGPDENIKLYCGVKKREINFDDKKYYLAFSNKMTDNYYAMEFVTEGDVVDRYKEMILVQCNTSDVKPMQVLFAVMKGIHQNVDKGKAKQYPVSQNGQRFGFDFVVGEDNFFKEWNMFTYSPLPKSKVGVLMFGLSERAYVNDSDYENFRTKAKELKKKYEDKLMNFSVEELF